MKNFIRHMSNCVGLRWAVVLYSVVSTTALLSTQLNTTAAFTDWSGLLFVEPLKVNQPDFVCSAVLLSPSVILTAPSCFDPVIEAPRTAAFAGQTLPLTPRAVYAGDASRTLVGWTLEHTYVNTPSVEGDRLSVVRINRTTASLALGLQPMPLYDGQIYPPASGLVVSYGPDNVTALSAVMYTWSGVRALKSAPVVIDALGSVTSSVGRCGYPITGGVVVANKPTLVDPAAADPYAYLCGNLGDIGAPVLLWDARPRGQFQEGGSAAGSGYGNWSAPGSALFSTGISSTGGGRWAVAGVMVTADTLFPCATRQAVFTSAAWRAAWVDEWTQRFSRLGGAYDPPVCPSATPSRTAPPSISATPSSTPSPSVSPSPRPPPPPDPPKFPYIAVILSVAALLLCGSYAYWWRMYRRSHPLRSARVLDRGALRALPHPVFDSLEDFEAAAAREAQVAKARQGELASTAPDRPKYRGEFGAITAWRPRRSDECDEGEGGETPLPGSSASFAGGDGDDAGSVWRKPARQRAGGQQSAGRGGALADCGCPGSSGADGGSGSAGSWGGPGRPSSAPATSRRRVQAPARGPESPSPDDVARLGLCSSSSSRRIRFEPPEPSPPLQLPGFSEAGEFDSRACDSRLGSDAGDRKRRVSGSHEGRKYGGQGSGGGNDDGDANGVNFPLDDRSSSPSSEGEGEGRSEDDEGDDGFPAHHRSGGRRRSSLPPGFLASASAGKQGDIVGRDIVLSPTSGAQPHPWSAPRLIALLSSSRDYDSRNGSADVPRHYQHQQQRQQSQGPGAASTSAVAVEDSDECAVRVVTDARYALTPRIGGHRSYDFSEHGRAQTHASVMVPRGAYSVGDYGSRSRLGGALDSRAATDAAIAMPGAAGWLSTGGGSRIPRRPSAPASGGLRLVRPTSSGPVPRPYLPMGAASPAASPAASLPSLAQPTQSGLAAAVNGTARVAVGLMVDADDAALADIDEGDSGTAGCGSDDDDDDDHGVSHDDTAAVGRGSPSATLGNHGGGADHYVADADDQLGGNGDDTDVDGFRSRSKFGWRHEESDDGAGGGDNV